MLKSEGRGFKGVQSGAARILRQCTALYNRLEKIVEITASPETLSKTQVRSGIGSVLAAAVREPGTLGLFCSQKSSADCRKNKESRKNQQIL